MGYLDYLKHGKKMFLKKFAVAQGTNVVGRLIPFGIGAVVGGGGNHLLGRQIVRSSREAFGPAPEVFPAGLDPQPKAARAPRAPRERPTKRMPVPSRRNRGAIMAPGPRPDSDA